MILTNESIGSKFSFMLYGSIGTVRTMEATLVGIGSYSMLPPESGADINHANIWPEVPSEIRDTYQDNPAAYAYAVFITASSERYYIGIPWINASTITVITTKRATVTISNFNGDVSRLYALLESDGHERVTVVVEDA